MGGGWVVGALTMHRTNTLTQQICTHHMCWIQCHPNIGCERRATLASNNIIMTLSSKIKIKYDPTTSYTGAFEFAKWLDEDEDGGASDSNLHRGEPSGRRRCRKIATHIHTCTANPTKEDSWTRVRRHALLHRVVCPLGHTKFTITMTTVRLSITLNFCFPNLGVRIEPSDTSG